MYDAANLTFRELRLRRDPNRQPITRLVDYQQFCGIPAVRHEEPAISEYTPIGVAEFKTRWDGGWRPYVLDVRKPYEADIVSLPMVDRLEPHETVARIAGELPRDREIVISCRSGVRSAKAAVALHALGFDRLYNLEGGVLAWATEIDPSLPTY